MNRRAALAGIAVSALGIAGCLDALESGEVGESEETGTNGSTTASGSFDDPSAQFQYGARNTGVADSSVPRSPTVRWETRLSPIEGGLAVANGRVVVTTTGDLVALDVDDGTELWSADVGHTLAAPPAVGDDTAYVTAWNGGSSIDRGVVAIDVEDGSERWRAVPSVDVSSAPTLADGTVYVGGSLNSSAVIALEAATGEERWRFEAGQHAPTPAVADGTVYAGGGTEHTVYAIDAETGDERWRFDADDRVWGAPTIVDDTVYVGSRDGRLYALAADTGEERWRERLGTDIRVSVAAINDRLYVPTDEALFAIDTTGETQWSLDGGGGFAPAVADESLVVANQAVGCLDLADGEPRWVHEVPSRIRGDVEYDGIESPPVVDDGVVYVASHGGDVFALAGGD